MVVAVAVVVRMSQRHAFVAYNCPRYALFRFSPSARPPARRRSDPSRFSVIAVAVGERLAARRYFRTVYLYTKTRTAPSVSVLVGAARSSGQRTHPGECRREKECIVVGHAMRSQCACGPDQHVRYHGSFGKLFPLSIFFFYVIESYGLGSFVRT